MSSWAGEYWQPGRVGAMVKACERESLSRAGLQRESVAINLEFVYDGGGIKSRVVCEGKLPAGDVGS